MDPNRYTVVSARAGERYHAVLTTFRGMLFAFLNERFSVGRADDLRRDADEVGRMFLRSETPLILEEVTRTAQDALWTVQDQSGVQRTADISDTLNAFLTQHCDYLENELRVQLSRDAEMLVRRYREFALEAQLNGSANLERARFYFRDRVGRQYPSQQFVRSVWRHTLVMVAAECFALEAADQGIHEIETLSPDPESRWANFAIGLTDTVAAPSFSEVRDEVFHPQSQVTLRVVDVPT